MFYITKKFKNSKRYVEFDFKHSQNGSERVRGIFYARILKLKVVGFLNAMLLKC